MKSNITVLALNKSFKNKIAKRLSKKLDMFFANANDLIKYDLININRVIKTAGIDYYNKEESKIIKSLSSFENMLIVIDNSTFFNNNNYKYLKETSLFVYIKLSYEDFTYLLSKESYKKNKEEVLLDKKVFKERDKVFSSLCDIEVKIDRDTKSIEDKIIEGIKKYYKEVL